MITKVELLGFYEELGNKPVNRVRNDVEYLIDYLLSKDVSMLDVQQERENNKIVISQKRWKYPIELYYTPKEKEIYRIVGF